MSPPHNLGIYPGYHICPLCSCMILRQIWAWVCPCPVTCWKRVTSTLKSINCILALIPTAASEQGTKKRSNKWSMYQITALEKHTQVHGCDDVWSTSKHKYWQQQQQQIVERTFLTLVRFWDNWQYIVYLLAWVYDL